MGKRDRDFHTIHRTQVRYVVGALQERRSSACCVRRDSPSSRRRRASLEEAKIILFLMLASSGDLEASVTSITGYTATDARVILPCQGLAEALAYTAYQQRITAAPNQSSGTQDPTPKANPRIQVPRPMAALTRIVVGPLRIQESEAAPLTT